MPHESEKITRRKRIDPKLKAIGWIVVPYVDGMDVSQLTNHAVEEYQTVNGPADYALFVNGMLLGIVEAKKLAVGAQNVLEQAKRYSQGATRDGTGNWNGYRVPFLYSSNGETHWFIDMRDDKAASRQIMNLHPPSALEDFVARDRRAAFEWFLNTRIEDIARLRPYQQRAIQSAETAILSGKRSMLLAMATGTGKTYTTAAQIYRMLESRYAKRILFLVDRKALAAQAVREFSAFNTPRGNKFNQEYEVYSQRFQREDFGEDEVFDPKVLPEQYLTNPNGTQTFIYVCTIQRMAINLFGRSNAFGQAEGDAELDDDADTLDIPIHAFDVIIADECHRGYTAQDDAIWQSTLQHFDALKIGLTATPAKHTVAVFGEPVFRYGVQEAIRDGYLVDYEAISIRSDVRINGAFLEDGERVIYVDTATGEQQRDQLEDERQFSSTEIEAKITAPDSNRKIIAEVAKYARQHQAETGRFPKMLIFAVNDVAHTSHADSLVTICRDVFAEGDSFVKKITGNKNVDRPLQRIREFRNRPEPKIVVTVDMLSTGVDIPALEFIVFLRPVKSRILWEQMLGRGTRLCPDIKKSHFTIFDCFDGTLIEYFKGTTGFEMESHRSTPVSIPEIVDRIWNNVERDYNVKRLVGRLRRIEKDMSGDAREQFARFIPDGDIGLYAQGLPSAITKRFTETMKLLRDKDFQEILENYPRTKRTFIVAPEVEDTVTSEVKFRVGEEYLKPQDYLKCFSEFVSNNKDGIEAVKVLLERPKGWRTDKLEELRDTLSGAAFPEPGLQKAHDIVYKKPMVDIISMVKHAARQEEPLYNATERVDKALAKVMMGRTFTEEQTQWLGYIREHLIANLTLENSDFEIMPIFSDKGGLGRARRVFSTMLDEIVDELNLAVAE